MSEFELFKLAQLFSTEIRKSRIPYLAPQKQKVLHTEYEHSDERIKDSWGCLFEEGPRMGMEFDDDWQPGFDPLRPNNLNALMMGEIYDSL